MYIIHYRCQYQYASTYITWPSLSLIAIRQLMPASWALALLKQFIHSTSNVNVLWHTTTLPHCTCHILPSLNNVLYGRPTSFHADLLISNFNQKSTITLPSKACNWCASAGSRHWEPQSAHEGEIPVGALYVIWGRFFDVWWPFELKTGTPVTPALGYTFTPILVLHVFFSSLKPAQYKGMDRQAS